MEFNKLFAAILFAGILAMLTGFIAKKIIHVEAPEENAFKIDVAEDVGSGGVAKVVGAEPILALLATADIEKGAKFAKVCAACHSFDKGGPSRVGPNLWDVVGSKHGHMEGFAYSDAMMAVHDKDWTYQDLNTFLWKPKVHLPGTKMVFAGIRKPQARADVIAYLRTLSDNPVALPSESDIASEAIESIEEVIEEAGGEVTPAIADAVENVVEEAVEAVEDDTKPE